MDAANTIATPRVIAKPIRILRRGWADKVRQTRSLDVRMVPASTLGAIPKNL
jgi:hypothetical protein